MMMVPSKQISRDDVEKAADRINQYVEEARIEGTTTGTELIDAAAMLRSLMDRVEKAEKQCAYSWVVIANSFGGDWSKASSEWQDMARACEWPRPAKIDELWRGD